jgi:hypothetical protein
LAFLIRTSGAAGSGKTQQTLPADLCGEPMSLLGGEVTRLPPRLQLLQSEIGIAPELQAAKLGVRQRRRLGQGSSLARNVKRLGELLVGAPGIQPLLLVGDRVDYMRGAFIV